jgi:Flp pilus assembly pilin Flp
MKSLFLTTVLMVVLCFGCLATDYIANLPTTTPQSTDKIPIGRQVGGPSLSITFGSFEEYIDSNFVFPENVTCPAGKYVNSYNQTTGQFTCISSAGAGGGVTATWGGITGTLSNQTDLNTALAGKQPAGNYVGQSQTVNGVAYGSGNIIVRDAGYINYSSEGGHGGSSTPTYHVYMAASDPTFTTTNALYTGVTTDNIFVTQSNTSIFGLSSIALCQVALNAGVAGVTVDGNIEQVLLPGSSSNYTYLQNGLQLNVYLSSNSVLVLTVALHSGGTNLTFTNGTVAVTIGGGGVLQFGGTAVSSSSPTALTPGTITSTVTSYVAPVQPPPPSSTIMGWVSGAWSSITSALSSTFQAIGNYLTFTLTGGRFVLPYSAGSYGNYSSIFANNPWDVPWTSTNPISAGATGTFPTGAQVWQQYTAAARLAKATGTLGTYNTGTMTNGDYCQQTSTGVISCASAGTGTGGGVSSVSGTSPIASSGGSTPVISIQQSSGSQSGYLSSTDWTTFNGKQAALGYTPLAPANNLSDVSSAATARSNLGLARQLHRLPRRLKRPLAIPRPTLQARPSPARL